MSGIYLGLGSNLGNRLVNLVCCLKTLNLSSEIHLLKNSSIYESEPYGFSDQPWFLNIVVEIDTKLKPLELLQFTQQLEKKVGRFKTYRWGPRTIDIDILSYHNVVFKHQVLKIPHQQLHLRKFVLIPLKEIAACFVHSDLKKNIDELLNECQDKIVVNWFMDGNELLNRLE